MKEPKIAAKQPIAVELIPNVEYHWCACGLSQNQPFCNGSHRETEFTPLFFKVEKPQTYYLCQCKHSKNKPYCDGSHNKI